MSSEAADRLVRALLFEGYLLYPYRASSLKNQKRWAFGTLYPAEVAAAGGDASSLRTECLVRGVFPRVGIAVRFLQFTGTHDSVGDEPSSDGRAPRSREGVERCIELELVLPLGTSRYVEWGAPALAARGNGAARTPRLRAMVTATATLLEPALYRLAVEVANATAASIDADEEPGSAEASSAGSAAAELVALGSVHTVLSCEDGEFVSLLEPPVEFRHHAEGCRNVGTWPVLVGEGDTVMLSSPIILYDRPKVAAPSPGDLFDATEIDEILSLRIRTLAEAERGEAMRTDPRAREILERTEALDADGLLALHATCRLEPGSGVAAPHLRAGVAARRFGSGDRVVLRPRPGGDVLDLALAGEAATVLGIEEDVEGRVYYTVTVDSDPGRDLGALGQPGHRFFFTEAELERVP